LIGRSGHQLATVWSDPSAGNDPRYLPFGGTGAVSNWKRRNLQEAGDARLSG